jgi:hypothetical protein
MVRKQSPYSSARRPSGVFSLARLAALGALIAGLLTGCGEQPVGPSEEVIALDRDVLPGRNILGVERADTDSDGTDEWLVFYRFDQVEDRGPVAALVYDVVFDPEIQLPVVYPYKLRTPNENYLAHDKPEVTLVDLVQEPDGVPRKELVFHTEPETDLIFFRLARDPGPPPTDNPPLYQCIGFFRSPDGVQFDEDTLQVTVTSRSGLERSDLVRRHFYRPEADGYFITGTNTLVSPFAAAIDFPAGIPTDILDTPYAEKIVLAFYRTFGKTNPEPSFVDYLSPQAAKEFQEGRLNYGSPFPFSAIRFAVVKELSYYPTQDGTQATIVMVKVQFRSTSDQLGALMELRWTMTRVDGRWKMDYPQS